MADGLDVLKIDASEVTADEVEGSAEEAAPDCEVKLQERTCFEQDGLAFLAEVGGGEAVEFAGPVVFFGTGPLGGSREGGWK